MSPLQMTGNDTAAVSERINMNLLIKNKENQKITT